MLRGKRIPGTVGERMLVWFSKEENWTKQYFWADKNGECVKIAADPPPEVTKFCLLSRLWEEANHSNIDAYKNFFLKKYKSGMSAYNDNPKVTLEDIQKVCKAWIAWEKRNKKKGYDCGSVSSKLSPECDDSLHS